MIILRQTDDQRILLSDWTRGTTSRNQPQGLVSNAAFLWWLTSCKKAKTSIDFFKRYCSSKKFSIRLGARNQKGYSQMLPSLDDYVNAKKVGHYSIPSWDINDQRILQSDWMRGLTGNSQPKVVISDVIFL